MWRKINNMPSTVKVLRHVVDLNWEFGHMSILVNRSDGEYRDDDLSLVKFELIVCFLLLVRNCL